MNDLSTLPPVLAMIARAIGVGPALTLAAEFGGTQISVRQNPNDTRRVARVIGIEATVALHRLIQEEGLGDGLRRLDIPRAHARQVAERHAAIRRRAAGATVFRSPVSPAAPLGGFAKSATGPSIALEISLTFSGAEITL